jgi:hypothetical protein
LLDDLTGRSVEHDVPDERRRDSSHIGQCHLLVHIVRQQILRAGKACAQTDAAKPWRAKNSLKP